MLPSIFQASRSQAKESFTRALQVTVASARISHAQACKHGQFAYGRTHSQLDTHVSSPIPDTHFAHQPTCSSAPHTGTAIPPCAHNIQIGTFQRKPVKSHRRHNCGLQGSAYAHCTRAYLTSTVLATLASLLFLNTVQLPQTAITH